MAEVNMLDAALQYIEHGWYVFPLHNIEHGACTCRTKCGSPGKHPRIKDWDEAKSNDYDQVVAWWVAWPNANIGLATGPDSGLWVLDIDAHRSVTVGGVTIGEGEHSVRRLELQHNELPPVPSVETPSGGQHLFFKYPSAGTWGNRSGIRPSLDIRGNQGYVVAPPSQGISGGRYLWLTEEQIPAVEPPEWLLAISTEEGEKPWSKDAEVVNEGEGRHEWLFKYAASRRGVHGDDEDEILAALVVKNEKIARPPLKLHELEHIAKNVVAKYKKNEAPPEFTLELPKRLRARIASDQQDEELPGLEEGQATALSLFDLISNPPPTPAPLVEGMFLSGQAGIMVGPPNGGKSWVIMAMALAVARGARFLGKDTTQRPVIYVDEEGGLWSDYTRMRMLLAGEGVGTAEGIPLWFAIKKRLKLDTPQGVEAVARMMDRYEPGLIVFDSLVRLGSADENSNREMQGFFERADVLMENYACSVLFLHHTRKRGATDKPDDDPFEWARGASEIQAWPQSTWVLKKTTTRLHPELWTTKQRDMPLEDPFGVQIYIPEDASSARVINTGALIRPDKESFASKQDTIMNAIDTLVASKVQPTLKAILTQTGMTEGRARPILDSLVQTRQIEQLPGVRMSMTGQPPLIYQRK